jgi:hypothetical protein
MRSKAFFINGGAGRVICSIPAFEKYAETHDDFIIVCEGGTDFFKGHPTLHNKAYDNWHKGLFEDFIKDRDCVSPEPYRNWHYYNQKCSLAQAFDIIINDLDEPRELPDPKIILNKMELLSGYNSVEEVKAGTGKDKIVVVQPFGRSTEQVGKDFIADPSSRSFPLNAVVQIINELKKDYGVIIMSEVHFPLEENEEKSKYKVARPQIPDMRLWSSIINAADHFVGCDSMGQHIAKAFGKTATVVTGSTYPINISYPNSKDFDIVDVGKDKRRYSPIRISMDDEIDRYNDEAMEMTNAQIKQVVDSVKKRLGKSVAYTGDMTLPSTDQSSCCSPSLPSANIIESSQAKIIPALDKKGFGTSSVEKEIKKLIKN